MHLFSTVLFTSTLLLIQHSQLNANRLNQMQQNKTNPEDSGEMKATLNVVTEHHIYKKNRNDYDAFFPKKTHNVQLL